MEEIFTYFWWAIIPLALLIIFWVMDEFLTGLIWAGLGLLLDLVIILLGPALHFLITVYFAGDYSRIETAEGLVIGASAVAGILLIGLITWVIMKIIGWENHYTKVLHISKESSPLVVKVAEKEEQED
jgi:hypothetical protein